MVIKLILYIKRLNNGTNVLVSGVNLLTAFNTTNVKIQDGCIYTITNSAKGNDTNGFIVRLTNDITINRDEGYYIPIMINNNGEFKTIKLNSSNINLSLPKYTELEVNISVDSIGTILNSINTNIIDKFETLQSHLTATGNKLNSLDTINEELVKIKNLKKKSETTKLG